MAILINEQRLVDDNIFKYEERISSKVSRFLDKSPVFTTYFHINVNESTTDGGYKDVEEIVGKRSPVKFQKIEQFPIYGIDSIVLDLDDADEGLNTNYQGEGVILPNTIKPLQNDYFMISHLDDSYIFRITAIEYDNIRPDNFYKISFKFEYLDKAMEEQLNTQVNEKYTCLLQNIGTENTCLIEESSYQQVQALESMYNEIVTTYKAIFYDQRYNCFIGRFNGGKIFDPLQSVFINSHKLINRKNDLSTILLSEGFADSMRKIKYEKSIYRFFERRDSKRSQEFRYMLFPGMYKKDSAFYRWHDEAVQCVDIPTLPNMDGKYILLPNEVANIFKLNGPTDSEYIDLMRKFIRNEEISIYDIPLDLHEALLSLDANEEFFFFTPILMYIIQTVMNAGLS